MAEILKDNYADLEVIKGNLNDLFLVIMGMNVFFMQTGFAFLEAGSVRAKNVTNILFKNMFDVISGAITFWLFGYAIAYGEGHSFVGMTYFFLSGIPDHKLAHWFFNFAYLSTAATIISGAVAERCQLVAYLCYTTVISTIVFPTVVHWCWSPIGWLFVSGFKDFSGSGVVHLCGGTCALVAIILLGPRTGRFGPDAKPLLGHSIPFQALGGFVLFFGFLSFNVGSQFSVTKPEDRVAIARSVVSTVLCGSSSAIVAVIIQKIGFGLFPRKYYSLQLTINAAICGLAASCAGCNVFRPWSAVATGSTSALVFLTLHLLVLWCRLDDPVDAVAVHMGGGFWGLLAVPLFTEGGILATGASEASLLLLKWNMLGAASIIGWSVTWALLIFGTLNCIGYLRYDLETEKRGIDLSVHGEAAYPFEAWEEDQCHVNRNHISKISNGDTRIGCHSAPSVGAGVPVLLSKTVQDDHHFIRRVSYKSDRFNL